MSITISYTKNLTDPEMEDNRRMNTLLRSLRRSLGRVRLNARRTINVGPIYSLRNLAARHRQRPLFRLHTKRSDHPLVGRRDSSDFGVFRQIFQDREYESLRSLGCRGLIVDAGANVGYSAAFFLSAFPEAKVIALEPDEANFELLVANTAPWHDRIWSLRAGLWSHPTLLAIRGEKYRDGSEAAVQVREAEDSDSEVVPALDIPGLLAMSRERRIKLLKIDIEGAEAVVFGRGSSEWIDAVDAIAIELHDDSVFGSSSAAFHGVVDHAFSLHAAGENVIALRRTGF